MWVTAAMTRKGVDIYANFELTLQRSAWVSRWFCTWAAGDPNEPASYLSLSLADGWELMAPNGPNRRLAVTGASFGYAVGAPPGAKVRPLAQVKREAGLALGTPTRRRQQFRVRVFILAPNGAP